MRLLRALLARVAPALHEHHWTVAWNDDDECACGAWRYWPSGVIEE